MAVFGYARVSTQDQDLGAQLAALEEAGCAKVYREKVSGAKSDRAELAKVKRVLQAGDVLVVTRLDRLARSTRDLLNTLHDLASKGIAFKSLAEPMIDTTSAQGRLILAVLAALEELSGR